MKAARRLYYVTFTVALLFEQLGPWIDVSGKIGWYVHADLKSWLPIGIAFTPIELSLITVVLLWMRRTPAENRERPFSRGLLFAPAVAFGIALALGVGWGLVRGGDNLTFALFEVRDLAILILCYLLVGMLIRDEQDLSRMIWCMLIACAGLAINNTLRYFLFYVNIKSVGDVGYDHVDTVILAFGAVLCCAIMAFGGTLAQRWFAAGLFPLLIVCLAVMQRRAAWPVLGIGLVALAIICYRVRPRLFWQVVPVFALLIGIYLGAFWNNQTVWGQPARAIRSQFSPDPRDASSDFYRLLEHANILANISSSKYLGLGFGQQFTFYYALPDLSSWPFWHYTTHNAVDWLWMDGGIPVFFAFWWMLVSATFYGSQELVRRREAWSLTQIRLRRSRRRRDTSEGATVRRRSERRATARQREHHATVESGEASEPQPITISRTAKAYTDGTTALLAAGVCLIGMQVVFSYVDLGFMNESPMMLLGVILGTLGRTYVPRQPRQKRLRRVGRTRATTFKAASSEAINTHSPVGALSD